MKNKYVLFSIIYMICSGIGFLWVFDVLLDYQGNLFFESENTNVDFFKFIAINLCFGAVCFLVFNLVFNFLFLSKMNNPSKVKQGMFASRIMFLIMVFIMSAIFPQARGQSKFNKLVDAQNIKINYKTENKYEIYELNFEDDKILKLGAGAEVRKFGKAIYKNLGTMTCSRSRKDCLELILKNREKIDSTFAENKKGE